MNSDNYIEFLKTHIKPWARLVSGKREINCRCRYCQDSGDLRHGHFYINVDFSHNEPSYYYCQKCHAKGIVTSQKLLEWGVYDQALAIDINQYNSKVLKLEINKKYKDKAIYNLNNCVLTEDELSLYKLNYINNRLGTHLTYKDCMEKKIVLNLQDLIRSNNIIRLTRSESIFKQLDSNFIGFISYDNAFVNMRNLEIGEVYHTINKRYVNYNIFDKYDNTTKFYVIPNQINTLSIEPIKIHIAEGPFDILSILYNLNDGMLGNSIYAACTGSGYMGLLRFLLLNMKLINIEVHIYPDNDQYDKDIINIKEYLYLNKVPFFIHRNMYEGEKDFGVPKNRIRENIISV